jgi:hypothetical protein
MRRSDVRKGENTLHSNWSTQRESPEEDTSLQDNYQRGQDTTVFAVNLGTINNVKFKGCST